MPAPTPNVFQLRRDRAIRTRICVVTTAFALAFSGITWRLVHLQMQCHEELSKAAAKKYQREETLPAHRGPIRDRIGEYLAHDETVWELHTDRYHLRNPDVVRREMAQVLNCRIKDLAHTPDEELFLQYARYVAERLTQPVGMDASDLEQRLTSHRPIEVLKSELTEKQAEAFRGYLRSEHISGVYIRESSIRLYPDKDRLTLLLGGIRPGDGATWGIERLCDEVLKGTPGTQWVERDRAGHELPVYRGEVVPPQNGAEVFTTIDMNLQETTEVIVERAFLEYEPKSVVAILVDPFSGAILSMACRPHLDRETHSGNWRNMPISDAYEPGSVMKIVTVAAALDAGLVSPQTSIDCHHGVYAPPELKTAPLHDCSTRLGIQSVTGVLSNSSNIGTYKLARMLGRERLHDAMERFGFGQYPGTGLTQEGKGNIRPVTDWTDVNMSRACIGYFLTATAMQQVMAYAAIANGGTLLRPQVIDRIAHPDGRIDRFQPDPIRQACSAHTARQVAAMLEKTVTDGSGTRAQIEGVRVAGKTGTRNVFDPKMINPKTGKPGVYRNDQQVVSFAGFAPVDQPRVACLVMVDNPKVDSPELQQGGLVAAPVFKELVTAALNHLEVRLDPDLSLASQTHTPEARQ